MATQVDYKSSNSAPDNSLAIYQSVVYGNQQLCLRRRALFEQFDECKQSNILSCNSTKRMKIILDKYHSILNNKESTSYSIEKHMNQLINSLENGKYCNQQLLTDFQHIKQHHKVQENQSEYNKLYKYLTSKSSKCNLKHCQTNCIKTHDIDHNNSLDLVTNIHLYFLHSHDINNNKKCNVQKIKHIENETKSSYQIFKSFKEFDSYNYNTDTTITPYYISDKKIRGHKIRDELCVNGFVHNEYDYIYIPQDIINLIFEFYYRDHVMDLLAYNPKLTIEMIEDDIIQALKCCCGQFNFSFDNINNKTYQKAMERKTDLLLQISDWIVSNKYVSENLFEQCIQTISINIIRSLPYKYAPLLLYLNDDIMNKNINNYENPSWNHIELIYALTWKIINVSYVTTRMIEKYINKTFLFSFIQLFACQDIRERRYLMLILHKIYGRCLKLRPYIIEIMSQYFYRMIYTNEFNHVNGIAELLQIVCAIIPGLRTPIKKSWQYFIKNTLVPLHKCFGLKEYWEQLTQCCVNYVAKDKNGAIVLLNGLIRYWPRQSSQKEEIFIMVCVNILNVLITHQTGFRYEKYKQILILCGNKLIKCMLSKREPVADRAITGWKEKSMQKLVDYDKKTFLPKLCKAFCINRNHLNIKIKQCSIQTENIYKSKNYAYWNKQCQLIRFYNKIECDDAKAIKIQQMNGKDGYDIVKARHETKYKRPLNEIEKYAKRQHFWKQIEKMAQHNLNHQYVKNK